MNSVQNQVPLQQNQTSLFPNVLTIKNETCTGLFDALKEYWWVILLLAMAALYYRYMQLKKNDEKQVNQSSQLL